MKLESVVYSTDYEAQIENTFGVGSTRVLDSTVMRGYKEPRLLVNARYAIPYEYVNDCYNNEGRILALFMDDMLDYSFLSDVENYRYEPNASPVAYVDSITLDEWIDKIRVENRHKKGNRYQALDSRFELVRLTDLAPDFYDRKIEKYPTFDPAIYEMFSIHYGVQDWYLQTVYEKDTGAELTKTLSFALNNVLCLPYIDITNDPILRRKYASYTVGHIKAAIMGKELGFERTEFGLYLPYKKDLEFSVRFNPGLRDLQ